MKNYHGVADANSTDQMQPMFAAGYHLTPSRLAGERVKAWLVGIVGAALLMGSIWASVSFGQLWMALVGLLAMGLSLVFMRSVLVDVENVRRQLWIDVWQKEVRTGTDIDGDGLVGPPVGHVVEIKTRSGTAQVTLANLDVQYKRPLVHFPAAVGRAVTADDVLYILDRAGERKPSGGGIVGLSYRAWEGQRLPSGTVLDRETWAGCLSGLVRWSFAQERVLGQGRVVELRKDIEVEDMKRAVKLGVKQAAREAENVGGVL